MTISVPATHRLGYFPILVEAFQRPSARKRAFARDVVVTAGVAAFTALLAQIAVSIPGTPVPVTGQTFAVLLSATVVGVRCAVAGQLLYIAVGLAGLPVFANHEHGWQVVHGTLGGYLVGFVLASALLGWQARHGVDRRFDTLAGSFLLATALIYLPGVWWLAHSLNVSYDRAIALGVAPFVVGDLLKAMLAGALVPAAWRLVGRASHGHERGREQHDHAGAE